MRPEAKSATWAGTQRHAIQLLQGDERLPMLPIDLVNPADVRVNERGKGLCLALKAGRRLRVLATSSGRNLKATKWYRFISSALETTPIPPPPSFSTTR